MIDLPPFKGTYPLFNPQIKQLSGNWSNAFLLGTNGEAVPHTHTHSFNQTPVLYYYNDKIYGTINGRYDIDSRCWLYQYDVKKGEISGMYEVWKPPVLNEHSRMAVIVNDNGYIVTAFQSFSNGGNNSPINVAISNYPEDVTRGFTVHSRVTGTNVTHLAYPALQKLPDGTLVLFVQDYKNDSTGGHFKIRWSKSTDGGVTWTDPVSIMDSGSEGLWSYQRIVHPVDNQGVGLLIKTMLYNPPASTNNIGWTVSYFLWSDDLVNWGNLEYFNSNKKSGVSRNTEIQLADLDNYYKIGGDSSLSSKETFNPYANAVTPDRKLVFVTFTGQIIGTDHTQNNDKMYLYHGDGTNWNTHDLTYLIKDFADITPNDGAFDIKIFDNLRWWLYMVRTDKQGNATPQILETTDAGNTFHVVDKFAAPETVGGYAENITIQTNYNLGVDLCQSMAQDPTFTFSSALLNKSIKITNRNISKYAIYSPSTQYHQLIINNPNSRLFPFLDFTCEVWIYPIIAFNTSFQNLFNNNTGGSSSSPLFELQINSTNGLRAVTREYDGNAKTYPTNYLPPLNKWTHLAFTRENRGQMKFYVNGNLISSQIDNAIGTLGGMTPLAFLNNASNQGSGFAGYAAEIRMWNYIRSQIEISDNYKHTLTGFENGLSCYLTFDEGPFDNNNYIPGHAAVNQIVVNSLDYSGGLK
ncbi:MAG TPA: sialidase family protein, partial [Bacteroidales bacterium]|nr:sialidase family protein [Bacteroidales bacterium]